MPISHKKQFGIYHWDTFDNTTFFIHEADTLDEAVKWTREHYGDTLRPDGADQVDIVDKEGNIVKKFKLG